MLFWQRLSTFATMDINFHNATFHIHQHGPSLEAIEDAVGNLLTEAETRIMAKFDEVKGKLGELKSAWETERGQIRDALASLEASVADLSSKIVDGGTAEERQAAVDELSALITDVKATIPDAPVPDAPPAEPPAEPPFP